MDLITAIQEECNRVREILPSYYYASAGATSFGAFMLKGCVDEGEAAIASGDVARMARALAALRGCAE